VPPNVKTLRAVDAPVQLDKSLVAAKTASPRLSDELFARLLAYGTPQQTHSGDVLFKPGDMDVDLIVVVEGSVGWQSGLAARARRCTPC
jgi:CRP-like cAMP-binding protein